MSKLSRNDSPMAPEQMSEKVQTFNSPMVKSFRLTYLAKGGGGCHPPLEILTIACLTFAC